MYCRWRLSRPNGPVDPGVSDRFAKTCVKGPEPGGGTGGHGSTGHARACLLPPPSSPPFVQTAAIWFSVTSSQVRLCGCVGSKGGSSFPIRPTNA